ncbi:MAG: transposase, partial [Magnetococcales bacterium]|nr:transposase [Magnetococcales bacterium]
MLNQLKCSLQDELDSFFQVLGLAEFDQRFVTAAALSKARKKLKASAFIELNNKSLDIFQKQFPGQKKWFGFRLLAVDGSKVELPNEPDIRDHFCPKKSHDRPMGLLSTLFDLNHRLWLDANLTPLSKGERAHAVDHLAHTKEDDLLLYDRGYPAFWLLALHRSMNRNFCMRLPFNFHKETSDFFFSEEEETTILL